MLVLTGFKPLLREIKHALKHSLPLRAGLVPIIYQNLPKQRASVLRWLE